MKIDKKSSKEKFKKIDKAFAAWGESDIDTSDDESSDEEMENLCLFVKVDDVNDIHFESNSFNDLQEDYNDLYEESLKMVNKYCMLRKQVTSLTIEIEN